MDKETLSNYGWIVILVLILAVLLALAGPFGTFVAGAIKSTTAGLFDVNQAAMGSAGINVDDLVFENCDHLETEIRNATDTYTGDTCCKVCGTVMSTGQTVRPKVPDGGKYTAADGTVYGPGEEMPEVVTTGDKYRYGDYEYGYNMYSNGSCSWTVNDEQNGWGVDTVYNSNSVYGAILESINGAMITNMTRTFKDCRLFTASPAIPSGVTNMTSTFAESVSLSLAPEIPNGVVIMDGTFSNCTALITAPVIPSSVVSMQSTFGNCSAIEVVPQIPYGVVNMYRTFMGCGKITTAPTIPNSVKNMEQTFYGCNSLKVAPQIPEGVENMDSTFLRCPSLVDVSNITIPSTVTDMTNCFMECSNLVIGPNFENATGLTNIYQTFRDCTSLTTVGIIPQNVTGMMQLFYNCTSLTGTIKVNANPSSYYNCFYGVDMSKITLAGTSTVKQAMANTGLNGSQVTIIN